MEFRKNILILIFLSIIIHCFAQSDSKAKTTGVQKIVYSAEQQALKISGDDIRIVYDQKMQAYHLYVRKTDKINSILLTETTRDPDGKITNYAYRAYEYNAINGDEIRYLDGKQLVSEGAKYSLIDSTTEKTDFFEEAFHILIPAKVKFGYSWGRNGEVEVGKGTFLNIRTFEKPYADYTGAFVDNPFMLSVEKRKKAVNVSLDDKYSPAANLTFKELSPVVVYSKGPESIVEDIESVLKDIKDKDNCRVVFAIDATGSMKDDIEQIRHNLVPVIKNEFEKSSDAQFGLLFYRDYGDNFKYKDLPVKYFEFTKDRAIFAKNLSSVRIVGSEGGDVPEAVYEALYACAEFYQWGETQERHVILIGDAPAHETPKGTKKYTREAAMQKIEEKEIQVHTILLPFDK